MRTILSIICIVAVQMYAHAQHSNEAAYERLTELTKIFSATAPFSCNAVIEVKYKDNAAKPLRDTSKLIYKNRKTYYRSRIVEHIEGSEGELTINHELKRVDYHISDSLRSILQSIRKIKPDSQLTAIIDKNPDVTNMAIFKRFLINGCNMTWEEKEGLEEIRFTPKNLSQATLTSVMIRFDELKIQHYEYSYRDVYATDYYGKSQFRVIKTSYRDFDYSNDIQIPVSLSDLLLWRGWTVKMKKYTDYKLKVL